MYIFKKSYIIDLIKNRTGVKTLNKKRLIITSTISIILVCILLIGSTYSIFTSSDVDEEVNVYQTGNLDVTYTLSADNVTLSNSTPTSIEDSIKIKPYRITVINNGTVPYQFNVLLENTTASGAIDNQYIMTQVGKIEPKSLGSCTNNIIKEAVIVPAGKSVDIDVRVWVSDTVQNTEINKSFFAKLTIDGVAVYDKNEGIDNSVLVAEFAEYSILLSEVEPGSYVAYTGTNGCTGSSCTGQNANYVDDTNMGYCESFSDPFTVNGWRIGYIKDDTAYLVSAGSPECMCTKRDGTSSDTSCIDSETTYGAPQHLANLNNIALKYCNPTYAYGGVCNSTSSWNMNATDFQNITGSLLSSSSCYDQFKSSACGYGNNLIDNGGRYWFATPYSSSSNDAFYWRPVYRNVGYNISRYLYGVRPILRLDSDVLVVGGSGTYKDPYQITPPMPKVKLGSYVSLTPTKSSYITDTSMTGYDSTQTINPQELNFWRVISINEDGTVDLISEHVSSVAIYFRGQTGYQNLVGYLNVLAIQYENDTYTTGSRYFGYNGQTEYITDTSKFTNPAPWTCSTGEGCNSVESQGGGDVLYTADYNLVNTVLGTRIATNPSGTAVSYWMASRDYAYSIVVGDDSEPPVYLWYGRMVNTSGGDSDGLLYYYDSTSFASRASNYALRPIVTLKSGLKYSGEGTESDPYQLSIS